jgi:hypothetical protein
VEPRIAWVAGTTQAGPGLPNYAYDELDVSAPLAGVPPGQTVPVRRTLTAAPGAFNQLQLSVRNRLVVPAGPLASTAAELTVGQDVDLEAGRLSETWTQGRAMCPVPFGSLSADLTARFLAFGARRAEGTGAATVALPASPLDAFTSLQAGLTAADRRGDNVHASFFAVGKGGSPRLLAGLEPFFDPRAVAADALATGSAGVVGRYSGATLTYDADFTARPQLDVYQHRVSFVWDSPCRCWKAGVNVIINDRGAQYGFVVDLSSLTERRRAF